LGKSGGDGIAFRGIGGRELRKQFDGGEPDLVVPIIEKGRKISGDAVALGRGSLGELY
jgi:hypothetical protein